MIHEPDQALFTYQKAVDCGRIPQNYVSPELRDGAYVVVHPYNDNVVYIGYDKRCATNLAKIVGRKS